MAYQDTDSYKEFMRKKYPGLVKKTKVRAESPPPQQQQSTKAKVTFTCLWRERERVVKKNWCMYNQGPIDSISPWYNVHVEYYVLHVRIVELVRATNIILLTWT